MNAVITITMNRTTDAYSNNTPLLEVLVLTNNNYFMHVSIISWNIIDVVINTKSKIPM